MSQSEMSCPRCGRTAPTGAAFCPYCGAPLSQPLPPVSDAVSALLRKADETDDPKEKHALLLEAQKEAPDCLEVEEALLFLGRLYERNPRKPDFSVIKCYLWQVYLTPQEFTAQKQAEMRREFFEDAHLRRCLALAPDPEGFLRGYLKRLAAEYVSLFLKGSNRYSGAIFGFRFDNRMEKVLASPVATMLASIAADRSLDERRRRLLSEALYQAFLAETGGSPRWLDPLLEKKGLPIPFKS